MLLYSSRSRIEPSYLFSLNSFFWEIFILNSGSSICGYKKSNCLDLSFFSNNYDYLNVNELIKHSQLIDNNFELDEEGNIT